MKVRTDFITNSSSSSYIIVYEIECNDRLKKYMQDEYGKYGVRILNDHIESGSSIYKRYSEIKDECGDEIEEGEYDFEFEDILAHMRIDEIDMSKSYLTARKISWTSEGDTEGDDAWLAEHIPSEYKKLVYEGESD